ncbi:hypothetical protein HKX48_001000 [Thoreauomyces humboldtii]|nr:hypothetical protein HKX48_001000 [Thoreauomyces humboldtii]
MAETRVAVPEAIPTGALATVPAADPLADVVLEADERAPLLGSHPGHSLAHAAKREVLGLSFMALSALLFSIMSVLVKVSGKDFPFLEIVLVRSIVQFALGTAACLYVGVKPWGPPGLSKFWLIARGSAGATGLGLFFWTILNMPLGEGMTIFFTGPAFTAIFARITLGEPLTLLDVAATIACLGGVALVSRPEFIFHDTGRAAHTPLAPLAALGGAILSAIAYCLVRKIGNRAHFLVHVTYFGGVSTLLSASLLFYTNDYVPLPSWTIQQTAVLLAVGLSAFIAQCFLNAGLQMAHAGPATLMRNLDVVFAFVFGAAFFHERPRITSIIGASIILTSTISVGLYKWLLGRRI